MATTTINLRDMPADIVEAAKTAAKKASITLKDFVILAIQEKLTPKALVQVPVPDTAIRKAIAGGELQPASQLSERAYKWVCRGCKASGRDEPSHAACRRSHWQRSQTCRSSLTIEVM